VTQRIHQIRKRLEENDYAYGGEALAAEDVAYLLSVLDRPRKWWDLYELFENKIAEKLKLQDELNELKNRIEDWKR
jgi:hypothetical protein